MKIKILALFMTALILSLLAPAAQAVHTKASRIANKLAGKKTASGRRYSPHQLTAASKTLPLGSVAKVKNKRTGKSTKVKITDRGPYVKGRGIDLSQAAAKKIGVKGVAPVDVKKVRGPM